MKFSIDTVNAAFEQHFAKYTGKSAFAVPHHIGMWNSASSAFLNQDFGSFEHIYETMRKRWQVFRGKNDRPSPQSLFDTLMSIDPQFANRTLSSLGREDAPHLWAVMKAVVHIKRLNAGPSVMAISKFLHFWNPRLFVIVDSAIMWEWVLKHGWIWNPVKAIGLELHESLPREITDDPDYKGDLGTYLAILFWCSDLIRDNPSISSGFGRYVRGNAGSAAPLTPADLDTYEAAAVEWFLMGVVELPPTGGNP